MNLLKLLKRIDVLTWVILIALVAGYFILRLPNINIIPVFADEAIYIRWAQVMRNEPTLRFLPLSDGKTPLFMWLNIPFFKIFSDPVTAGRMLSVCSGFFTMLGVLFLGWRFVNKRVGLWAAFLIVITPMFVFFDRMALVDSMMAAFSIWSLNFALLLVNYPRLDIAMFLGFLFGGGLLTKPPAFFNIIMMPLTLLLISWKAKGRETRFLKLFGLWVVAVVIALIIYNILRLGPGFSGLNSRNQDYVNSPSILLHTPLDPFIPHSRDVFEWSVKYVGLPTFAVILTGIGFILYKRQKVGMVVLFWGLIPLLIEMALLKVFTARYILFTVPMFMVVGALGIDFIVQFVKRKWIIPFLVAILLIWPAYFNFNLLFNPSNAPFPSNERRGYLEDWTAGFGLKDIASYLEEQSKDHFVVVGTEGYFGTLPDGLQIYLDKNRQVVVIGSGATVSAQIKESALTNDTYFVANRSRYPETSWQGVELIKQYPKAFSPGQTQDAMLFFKVTPEESTASSAQVNK